MVGALRVTSPVRHRLGRGTYLTPTDEKTEAHNGDLYASQEARWGCEPRSDSKGLRP